MPHVRGRDRRGEGVAEEVPESLLQPLPAAILTALRRVSFRPSIRLSIRLSFRLSVCRICLSVCPSGESFTFMTVRAKGFSCVLCAEIVVVQKANDMTAEL